MNLINVYTTRQTMNEWMQTLMNYAQKIQKQKAFVTS